MRHDLPWMPFDEDMPGLEAAARERMKGPAIRLDTAKAVATLEQFQETARIRGWTLQAVAIMFNHFHIVVAVAGDPAPSKILGDFKSYATRKLSAIFGKPLSRTWWTERGSKRKLNKEEAIAQAIYYVLYEQPDPLVTWSPETGLHYGRPPGPASVEALARRVRALCEQNVKPEQDTPP